MNDEKRPTIYELLSARAEHAPESVAIRAPGRSDLTYRGLLGQVDEVKRALHARGVQARDRVAIVLPNGPEMAVTFLGVAASAICAPLNPAYSENEFEFYLTDLKPKALIVQSGMNSPAIAVAEEHGIPVIELLPKAETAAGIFALSDNQQQPTLDSIFPQAGNIALILHTSGTTSRPKMVPLTQANLLASAGNIAAALRLSEADRCLNVMPLFHIHGLVGALLSSVMAGASVICASGLDSEQFFPWLEAFRPTWYTAVPTIHRAVLSLAQAEPTALSNHSLRFIRSSSAALPARVMQGLEETFKVPVIESYGMTEAAHQMASNPLPPGQRKVGSVGLAAGSEVSIMNEAGNLLSTGEIGEIVISGANVMHGYDNNCDANVTAFTQGWFRTGDQGYLDVDGYLFITGRLKEIINRGGEKISPREVDEVILQHPAVAEAISFAIPHETLGEDIAAAVVLREHAAVTERELQRFVAAHLAQFKIPRRVLFVDEIPKSATGKPQRIGLAEKLGPVLSKVISDEFLAPRTQLQKTLAAIWSEVLGVECIAIQDNFFNLGGDSIRATQVISRIRTFFNYDIPLRTLFEAPTVEDLATMIIKQQARLVSETEMARLLDDVEAMSSEDAEQGYKEQLTKSD
jgi:acyl-CoA synthetase (AMP-forming)/AMP-acid ligase II/acyl carrier protein